MQLSAYYRPQYPPITSNARIVMNHFGLPALPTKTTIANGLEVPIEPGSIVAFVGESGSGKSTLLRAAVKQLDEVCWLGQLPVGTGMVIDSLNLPAEDALPILAACGLAEASLLLHPANKLSDGQAYRLQLALALASKARWIVADEFTAILDRTLAKVIAYNVRQLAIRSGVGVLVATTHTDILDDLAPTVTVRCYLDRSPECSPSAAVPPEPASSKKKKSASSTTSPSPPVRAQIGRTLLAGTTAVTPSG